MFGTLTKLTVPRVNNLNQRNRLNKLLSSTLNHRVLWITSHACAGKTTIISSYLQKMKYIPLWYQIDEGDVDIAIGYSTIQI